MPRFSHISGDRYLDLVNTVEWRLGGPEREESLNDYGAVLDWCAETGLLSDADAQKLRTRASRDVKTATREHELVTELREAAYETLFEDSPAGAERIGALHVDALSRADLTATADGWEWRDRDLSLATPRDRIARGLVDLLRRDDLDLLHQCEDAICGWVYLDTSPRRNRRWCVTKDCGDRNRSRAYYARQKAKQA